MFRKEFKTKNCCQLKSSDKKKLFSNILSSFPNLLEDELQISFPSKESVQQMKLSTFQDEILTVYTCQSLPLMINFIDRMIPTVFFLWNHPKIVCSLTISSYVAEKLSKGADLMVPGIINYDSVLNSNDRICKGNVVSLNLLDNRASIGVGLALMSHDELFNSEGRGKAVSVLHMIDDVLFKLAGKKAPAIPVIPFQTVPLIEETDLIKESGSTSECPSQIVEEINELNVENKNEEIENIFSPDDMLMNAFAISLKKHQNQKFLPILTNVFYKNYILDSIPSDMNFDIKKTKYKKLSNFLSIMEDAKVIKLETSDKHVQSIVEVDFKHHLIHKHVDIFPPLTKHTDSSEKPSTLQIIEGHLVNSNTLLLFSKMGYNKGNYLTTQEVRQVVTDYVKTENLQDPKHKGNVLMNPILTKVTQAQEEFHEWKWILDKLISSMGKYYEVKKNGIVICNGKGKIPLIEICIKMKGGNKKVTLVDNLEIYGIEINEIARECQRGLAASTTSNKLPGKKSDQFQVQGCHIPYIKKLLTEKYLIPKKYINDGT